MESFPFSPKSPAIDTPVCDSDEEVFFGPVTSKELQKASQLKRRTQLYFPSFDWKPSTSHLVEDNGTSSSHKECATAAVMANQPSLSLSADSLESQNFVSLSDKPEDSSKGEFWSAVSGSSLDTNSQTSLNDAKYFSKFSEDSLETEQSLDSGKVEGNLRKSSHEPSLHSNISEDSLETSKHQSLARLHSGWPRDSLDDAKHPSEVQKDSNDESGDNPNGFTPNVTQSGSSFNYDSLLSTPRVGENGYIIQRDVVPLKTADALTDTYAILPEIKNDTYSIDNESCEVVDLVESSNSNLELANEVTVDQDGGFLSILSEAALYHASQLKENELLESQQQQVGLSTQRSLEERFKTFGIDAGELEEQQLSSSIMYMTGRESNVLCSETESNSFHTGRNSVAASAVESPSKPSCEETVGNSADSSAFSSVQNECGEIEVVNVTSESQESAYSRMQYTNVLNEPIRNGTLGSAASTFQSSAHGETTYHPKACQDSFKSNDILDQSSVDVRESSVISGICELNSVSGNQSSDSIQSINEEEPLNNDSVASSFGGELNDTLEEYEMMMRYGVDYILGRKGNQKKADHSEPTEESVRILQSETSQDHSDESPLPTLAKDCSSDYYSVASPVPCQENYSSSSVEYLDAVNVSPSLKKATNAGGRDCHILSPLQKQLLKRNPQKIVKDQVKLPSKLPRIASVTPSKLTYTPSPQSSKSFSRPITPSSETKAYKFHKPATPSSEPKSGLFKKPVTPGGAGSRIPKSAVLSNHGPKSNNKTLEKIQSPVGAYIHNTPLPVLVTNVKGKSTDRPSHEKEMHARALWRTGELKSLIPKPGTENINPNIGCGLPPVKYTKAPCIKLDEASKVIIPRGGEKITKLMDAPSPQVIKHEGRLRVNCGSPQLAAKMQSMADAFDDSLVDVHSISGDISVCVSQNACRTNTLGHHL